MKKINFLLVLLLLTGLGAGVFAGELLSRESVPQIHDEDVPLSSSQGMYANRISVEPIQEQEGTTTSSGRVEINGSLAEQGVIAVKFDNARHEKIKVSIEKDGNKVYYNYLKTGEYEVYPLVYGNGNYQVALLENTEGDQYRVLKRTEVEVVLQDENLPFLQSVQPVDWTRDDEVALLAGTLTEGLDTETEKFKALYRFVVGSIQYDEAKIRGLDHTYVPVNVETLEKGRGICYDYASLLASMLRSQGIPAKLVKGYGAFQPDVYHAWNEVLLDGQWILVDPSYDSQLLKRGQDVNVVKDPTEYEVVQKY